jgi:histidine triad (HIT) family protein
VCEADCLFCKIVRGEIDAEVVHDEDDVLAFRDINSKAPVHLHLNVMGGRKLGMP